MTVEEELALLEKHLRRLKIEYDVYFHNPLKKAPLDLDWKVVSLIRRFSDGTHMSLAQRFRYNEIAQRYAIYSELWRKRSRLREQSGTFRIRGARP
ncbi:MAG: hypothetical protein H0X25_01930 [Acidobacteriales bacterium]|nr:hypothetical protein [Terriglobales bacterium]